MLSVVGRKKKHHVTKSMVEVVVEAVVEAVAEVVEAVAAMVFGVGTDEECKNLVGASTLEASEISVINVITVMSYCAGGRGLR